MRAQACREKVHQIAEACGLAQETVDEIDKVSDFVKEHPKLCRLSTDAAKALMRIPDKETQQKAILGAENKLNRKTPTGGIIKKRLTKPEVKKIIEKISPSEKPENIKTDENGFFVLTPEPKPRESGSFAPAKGSIPVTDRPPQPSLAAQLKGEPEKTPEQAKRDEMNRLADALLELMPKPIQLIVTDVMREHPSYKSKDVIYYGIECLGHQRGKR